MRVLLVLAVARYRDIVAGAVRRCNRVPLRRASGDQQVIAQHRVELSIAVAPVPGAARAWGLPRRSDLAPISGGWAGPGPRRALNSRQSMAAPKRSKREDSAAHHRRRNLPDRRPPDIGETCSAGDQRRKAAASSTWADHLNWSIGCTQASRKPPSMRMRASLAKVAGLQLTIATRGTADLAISSA